MKHYLDFIQVVHYLIYLGPFIMEPHKRAKYSKSLDPDEIEEVLMDEDSDEELEDRDEVMEPRVQSSLSSENEDDPGKLKLRFGLQEPGILQIS